jgi:hypothetical protein
MPGGGRRLFVRDSRIAYVVVAGAGIAGAIDDEDTAFFLPFGIGA